eukprot:CAMPEP_0116012824 /NCGR_PEP_ID=MMETSP0321-20121206/5353_1 /TAXON_ID=163516 /ORGANISM="Leptocylindrus danicus var. danicus, Strain B650" /LENGTH=250 /DNA_ID=CAMNT_0003482241 /DNA_START=299 /DNA_END=1051 /DNA_ORIENTATION=+
MSTGEWPYTQGDMNRLDATDDANFYAEPRFVTHIDDRAIDSLTEFYTEEFIKHASSSSSNSKKDVLDLCSSWISHFPEDIQLDRVVGIGMNAKELEANPRLTEYICQDLNKDSNLPFEDESFDFICNVVSVDYLTSPLAIFQEMYRVLKPGGKALVSFSNRCFATKAVAMWLQADDIDRLTIVASYYHYAADWKSIQALDILPPPLETPKRPGIAEIMKDPNAAFSWAATAAAVSKANNGDPMFVVKAIK